MAAAQFLGLLFDSIDAEQRRVPSNHLMKGPPISRSFPPVTTSITSRQQEEAAKARDDTIVCFTSVPASARLEFHMIGCDIMKYGYRFPTFVNIPTTVTTPMQPQGPYSRTGILSTLPNELTTAICQSLDIKSCLRFRRVCRMSHALVSGMIEYRYVIQEAANVVDAYVRTQSADHITFSELYRVMHGIHCEGCGRLGHFIYLLLMVRCCSDCLRDKPRFRTVTLASFTKAAKATETKVRKAGVQLLLSIPDHYHKRRIKLVNFGEAARAMRTCPTIDVGFGIQDMNLMSGRLKAATLLPFFDATCLAVQQIMYCEGCRFRAWHLLAEKIINMTEYLTRRRGYHTRAEFLAHFDVCFSAQRLWALSRNGKTEVEFHEKVAAVSGDDPRPNY